MQRRHWLIIILVVVTAGIGVGIALWQHRAGTSPVAPITAAPVTYSVEKPDRTPIPGAFNWHGSADDPKFITLPRITASGYIQKMGVDQHKEVATPTNIHFAGWFAQSARPGTAGLSIIVGHITGFTTDLGIFQHLDQLKTGDTFTITRGDNKKFGYKVTKVATYPTAQAVNYLFSQQPDIRNQLNLITCAGTYDNATHSYTQRTIVYAAQT